MGDARVGEHPLYVALGQRDDVAAGHGQYGQNRHDGEPVGSNRPEAVHEDANQDRKGAQLGPNRQEARERRGRSLVGIRRPVMERDSRRLECRTHRQEADRHQQTRRSPALRQGLGDRVQVSASCQPKGPADAKQEDGAGERPEQEVLEPALVAVPVGLVEPGHHVGRHHHQLEAQEQRDQVARRREDAHPEQAEQQDRVELTQR